MNLVETPAVRITCEVYREISPSIAAALAAMGIARPYVQSGRSIMTGEGRGMFLSRGTRLIEDRIDIYRFAVTSEHETAVMTRLVEAGMLNQEGRGSVYSESVKLLHPQDGCPFERPSLSGKSDHQSALMSHLAGISVIVQRGQGDTIARAALDMGICVPSVTFGVGAGLRDKLGLIRITIPAEKEVVHITTARHDLPGVLSRLIEAGKLDQPGKGFIFTYPIERGLLNTRLYVGRHFSAASLGQIVAAIDEIKGSTAWRRKFTGTSEPRPRAKRRQYLRGLVDLSILCPEGAASNLAQLAMDAGASGATVGRLRRITGGEGMPGKDSPAREQLTMILPEGAVESVVSAVTASGLFEKDACGEIIVRPVPEAYTYLASTSTK